MIRTLFAVLMLAGMLGAFTGCNSMGGAGEDTRAVADEPEHEQSQHPHDPSDYH